MQTHPRPDGPSDHVYRTMPAMIGPYNQDWAHAEIEMGRSKHEMRVSLTYHGQKTLYNKKCPKEKNLKAQSHARAACRRLHVALCARQSAFWQSLPQYRTDLHLAHSINFPLLDISAVLAHTAHDHTYRPHGGSQGYHPRLRLNQAM
jgi:hypothetical protein